jgi:hypothetical protein
MAELLALPGNDAGTRARTLAARSHIMKPPFVNGITPRTDAEIFIEARRALDQRPGVPPAIRVHVDAGVLTLTGSVRSALERAEAHAAVCHIAGVRRVVDEIVLALPSEPDSGPADA